MRNYIGMMTGKILGKLLGMISGKKMLCMLIAVAALMLAGCSKTNPQYLIMAGEDNGFVAAYRAYFAIEGSELTKIGKLRYEKLIYGDDPDYKMVREDYYTFDISTPGSDPSEWEYKVAYSDSDEYDSQALISDLKQMGASCTGDAGALVTKFDNYRIVSVWASDGLQRTYEAYAAFRDDEMLTMPANIELRSIRDIYRIVE